MIQRWPNRDPIQEAGGVNLYRFNRNAPTMYFDAFGLRDDRKPAAPRKPTPKPVNPVPQRPTPSPANPTPQKPPLKLKPVPINPGKPGSPGGGGLLICIPLLAECIVDLWPMPEPDALPLPSPCERSETKEECRQRCHDDFDASPGTDDDARQLAFCIRRCNGGWHGPTPPTPVWPN